MFSNYSLCVTLPKWVIKDLGWEKGQEVDMSVDAKKGTILISRSILSENDPTGVQSVETELEPETRW